MPTVKIVQRNQDVRTQALTALTITVHYGDGVEANATILLRPGVVANDEKNIRTEIERLGNALTEAAKSKSGIEG